MKHNIPLHILPYPAAVDVKGRLALTITPDGCRPADAGEPVIGYSNSYDVLRGQTVDVVTAGFIGVWSNSRLSPGQMVALDAQGAVTATTDTASAIGVAVEPSEANEIAVIIRL
jgi:hypothetical protein